MRKFIWRLHSNQGGSVYIEMALLIIGVAMAVAPFMMSLGSTLGGKVQDIKTEVEQVGV
jgi:Flp pilus assembly pilin Flp